MVKTNLMARISKWVWVILFFAVISLIVSIESNLNNDEKSTTSLSQILTPEIIIESVLWEYKENSVNEIYLEDNVTAIISISVINSDINKKMVFSIYEDVYDEDSILLQEEIIINQKKNTIRDYVIDFHVTQNLDFTRGYYIKISGPINWIMEDKYPPRLKLIDVIRYIEPENPPIITSWILYKKWQMKNDQNSGSTGEFDVPDNAVAWKVVVNWEGGGPTVKGWELLRICPGRMVDTGEHFDLQTMFEYNARKDNDFVGWLEGKKEVIISETKYPYYYVDVSKANLGDCIIEIYFGYE